MSKAEISVEGAPPTPAATPAARGAFRSLRDYMSILQKVQQVALGRLYFRGCTVGKYVRVAGRPFVSRRRGSQIIVGDRVRITSHITRCELGVGAGARLEIGAHTHINYGTSLGATKLVHIGERCEIGTYVNVIDNNFHDLYERGKYPDARPVVIEDDVWLCSRVMVLPGAYIERGVVLGAGSIVQPGVRIGHHAIIAAGSVVHENVAPRSVVIGNPAQTIYTLPEPSA